MLRFVRGILPFLDVRTRKRLAAAAVLSTLAAMLEAGGLAAILPLMQAVTAASSNQPTPGIGSYLSPVIHHPTAGQLAAVLGLAVFVLFITKGLLALAVLRWNLGTILRSEAAMAKRLLSTYLTAPWTFHLNRNSADLQRTVQDSVGRVYEDGLVGIIGAFADMVILFAIFVVLVVVQPEVALFTVLFFMAIGFGYQRLIHGRVYSAASTAHGETMQAFLIVQQSLTASKEIGLLGRADFFAERLHDAKVRLLRGQRTLLFLNQLPRYYLEVALISGVGLLSAMLYATTSPARATGALALFLAAGFRLLPSLNRVIVAVNMTRAAQPALLQITTDLETAQPEIHPTADGPIGFDSMNLQHITFTYPGAPSPAIKDLTAMIERGASIGLVGSSGAGKSTLADIILGLLVPEHGAITIDGLPLAMVRHQWQRSIGYVPQQVALLDDTLKANITFGIAPEHIDHRAIDRAIRLAQLQELVSSLPSGIDSVIGESGVRLSGGQRQRIGIARALYSDPSILILDEATSALDSLTESQIAQTLHAIKGDLTMIIIAHRLSTIRACDKIYLLDRGTLIASGNFDSLEQTSAQFAELVRLGSVATDEKVET